MPNRSANGWSACADRWQHLKGVDTAAVNAVLFAAIQHLVISAATSGQFAGVPLKSDKDWDKIATAVKDWCAAFTAEPGVTSRARRSP